MLGVAERMIAHLHWADFEPLVDLMFARGGWQRVSMLGGTMADVDLVVDHPTLGERASVQVKSSASQGILDAHISAFQRAKLHARTCFVCHSPKGALSIRDHRDVHLLTGAALAEIAVKSGLFDWLMERSR